MSAATVVDGNGAGGATTDSNTANGTAANVGAANNALADGAMDVMDTFGLKTNF